MDIYDVAFAIFLYHSLFIIDLDVFGNKSVDFIITGVGVPEIYIIWIKYIGQVMFIEYSIKSCGYVWEIHCDVLFVGYFIKPIDYIFYNTWFLTIKILFDLFYVQFFLIRSIDALRNCHSCTFCLKFVKKVSNKSDLIKITPLMFWCNNLLYRSGCMVFWTFRISKVLLNINS